MGKPKRTLAIAVLTTTLVSCSARSLPATTPTISVDALRIGATTATYPLVLDLATAYNESRPLQTFDLTQANFQTMLASLRNGETAYFISNYLPADNTLWAAPIGQDAFAIIVNVDVNLTTLTTPQLRAIYQGQITNWSELGGTAAPIVVFSREEGSGTRAEFERMVMGYRHTTANAYIAASTTYMLAGVAQTSGSIGYVSMRWSDNRVRVLALDGILPTPDAVFTNRYPLRATLFVVGLDEPTADYRALIGWMQSPEGQAIVARHYAPLPPLPPNG